MRPGLLAIGLVVTLVPAPGGIRAVPSGPRTGPWRASSPARDTTTDLRDLPLAITLDDLPWVGPLPEGDTAAIQGLGRIAAVLRAHRAPATGFVVCEHAARNEAPLRAWAAGGSSLGNHSWAHRDLDGLSVEAWSRSVRRCDDYLKRYGSAYAPFFRFPMLHQGDTRAKRDGAAAVEHADRVARRKVGRPVAQVLLLHANTLVDHGLDSLLTALETRGVEFVSLQAALLDPVYALPDDYVGRKGLSWLYRIAPASPEDARWDDARADSIRSRFLR